MSTGTGSCEDDDEHVSEPDDEQPSLGSKMSDQISRKVRTHLLPALAFLISVPVSDHELASTCTGKLCPVLFQCLGSAKDPYSGYEVLDPVSTSFDLYRYQWRYWY